MQKWEYATVPLLVHATKQILDNWGEDGWELVAVIPGPDGFIGTGAVGNAGSCPRPSDTDAKIATTAMNSGPRAWWTMSGSPLARAISVFVLVEGALHTEGTPPGQCRLPGIHPPCRARPARCGVRGFRTGI